jgi:hypothetical protein
MLIHQLDELDKNVIIFVSSFFWQSVLLVMNSVVKKKSKTCQIYIHIPIRTQIHSNSCPGKFMDL